MGSGSKQYLEGRHEVKDAWVSHDKIKNILGFQSTTSLKNGLVNMWEWAKQQPKRTQKIWEEYELDNGIYSYWKK